MRLRLTAADLQRLERDIHQARGRVERAQQDRNDSLDGEEMHENAAFELADTQLSMWRQQLRELESIRASAVVVAPVFDGRVGLGMTVAFEDRADRSSHRVKIVGYGGGTETGGVREVSVKAPLAQLLEGKRSGEVVTGRVGAKNRTLTITGVIAE